MKDVISPFAASTSVDHDGRGNTFVLELTKPQCDESQSEVEGGGGRARLLHMSVAMGILAQWLCRLWNGGFVFARDVRQKKKKRKKRGYAWAGVSVANYGGHLF